MPEPNRKDDLVHTPGDDPRWRESYYFSFFDPETGIGGFSSIGKRPARGHAGFVNVIWGPDMPTLVASELDSFDQHDDDHSVAGLTYSGEEPFGAWRLAFDGKLNDGGSEIECDEGALGPTARSGAPKVAVSFDLTFSPAETPYLYSERDEWRDLFDGHIDEVGRVEGEVRIGDRTEKVSGRGGKDHSWGVRDWFKPAEWRWVDLVGSGGPELELWRARIDGEWIGDGALFSGGEAEAITSYSEEVTTSERPRKPRPTGIELEVRAGSGELSMRGDVVRIVPIVFSRDLDGTRLTSWNDRSLLRCETESGAEAWANVEFEALLTGPAGE